MTDSEAIYYSSSSYELPLSGSHRGVSFRLVPPLEGLDLFPGHRSRHSVPVELHEMIRRVEVDFDYHVWLGPPFCELTHRSVVVVEATNVH